MKAIIIDAPRRIRVGDWADPRVGPSEALVSTRSTGVCAGDLYIYQGKNPYAVYPGVAGHEIAGVVTEAGAEVQGPHYRRTPAWRIRRAGGRAG